LDLKNFEQRTPLFFKVQISVERRYLGVISLLVGLVMIVFGLYDFVEMKIIVAHYALTNY